MRTRVAAIALLVAALAACSSSSSGGAAPTGKTPTPTPTFTQAAELTISRVLDTKARKPGKPCPTASQAFSEDLVTSDDVVACDSQSAYLLAEPVLDQTAIDATSAGRSAGGKGWTVYLQLSSRGARALAAMTRRFAVVYNDAVVGTSANTTNGLVLIEMVSMRQAKRIAAALNPS